MRILAAVLVTAVLAGCTSVKMVQRDGCWVRRTEKRGLGTVVEEIGPCARPAPAYVENEPLTRMVQECVARADYRWQMRALAAWDRHEPWPAQLSDSSVLQQCMADAAKSILGEAAVLKEKNAALEQRLAALAKEHDALKLSSDEERKELVRRSDAERKELVQRSDAERKEMMKRSDQERKQLVTLQAKLGEHLGAAAKRVDKVPAPAPAIATATATSEGRSRTDGARDAQAQPATLAVVTTPGAPAACVVPPNASAAPSRQARTPRKTSVTTDLPACDPSKTPPAPASAGSAAKGAEPPAAVPFLGTPATIGPAPAIPDAAAQARQ
jgi:hypothetical protein